MYLVKLKFKNANPHYLQVMETSICGSDGKPLTVVGATENIAKATKFATESEATSALEDWVFYGEFQEEFIKVTN